MSAPVGPGDVLAGKYLVERVLGTGGMGVVVAARHLQLDQNVALKFLLPEAVANPEALGRFVREARNAARLKSEHVARIIDVGTLETGAPYIVMEYLEGTDLAGVLAEQRTLPVAVAVDYVLQACDAIAEAHALGIIHRDLKPQNLFVTRRNDRTRQIKVLDFGISKSIAGGGDFVATRTQAVMGSPAYMSPEQMRSTKLVDARTDVWALGVILYQLVVGRVPWEAESFTELCLKVAMDPLPPFPSGGAVPAGFEDAVRRCLEKDPQRRIANVHALAVALLPFAPAHAQPLVERIARVLRGDAGERASLPTMSVPDAGTLREASGQRESRTMTGPRKRRVAALVAGSAVLVGLIVTAVALGSGGGSAGKAPPSHDHAAASPVQAPPSGSAAAPSPPVVTPPVVTPPVVTPSVVTPSVVAAPPVVAPPPVAEPGAGADVATKREPATPAPPASTSSAKTVSPLPKVTTPPARPREHRHAQTPPATAPAKTQPATPDPLSSPD